MQVWDWMTWSPGARPTSPAPHVDPHRPSNEARLRSCRLGHPRRYCNSRPFRVVPYPRGTFLSRECRHSGSTA